MFGSQILDVAIGMIFVFLLLSLICSALNEVIEAKLKNRATNLELGIRTLLGNSCGLQILIEGIIRRFAPWCTEA